jgi:hypothetical protein
MKNLKTVLLSAAIIMEIVGIILIVKASTTGDSATIGIFFLLFGLAFLVAGLRKKVVQ